MAFKNIHELVRWVQGSRYKDDKEGPVLALARNYWSGPPGVWPRPMLKAARAALAADVKAKRYFGSVGKKELNDAILFIDVKLGRRKPDAVGLGTMLAAYVDAVLQTAEKEHGGPFDDRAFTNATVAAMKHVVEGFLERNSDDVDTNLHEAGRDLWLTRNREGAGFWSHDHVYGKDAAARLTSAAHALGESNVDLVRGRLHVSA